VHDKATGEERYMDPNEVSAERTKAQDDIKTYCAPDAS